MSKRIAVNETSNSQPKKKMHKAHWAAGLLGSMEDPDLQIHSDDKVTAIKDKFPKAKYHYLVLPKEDISSIRSVKKEHLDLLKHMHQVGLKLSKLDKNHEAATFKLGYHAEPSMFRLHLHVISDDMNSACLKTKKHWNSFTSEFFLDSQAVIDDLEKNGKISFFSREKCRELIDKPLKCHKCGFTPKNMPDLKKHVASAH